MKPITLLFGLLMLSGCASAGTVWTTETPPMTEDEEETDIPRNADARGVTGTWRGSYICAQGLTSLRLDLRGGEDGRVEGTFSFSAHPDNPGVPRGSYRVYGRLTSGLVLRLEGGEWIDQPEGYFPVPLVGRMELERVRYYGFVDFLGCETFSVTLRQ
ncbi:MAG TPA: hypothetical protein VF006_28115 [Longimicrobium sp.]